MKKHKKQLLAQKQPFLFLNKPLVFWGLIGIIALYGALTIWHLGSLLMWGDEAFRGLMGQSVLAKGYPNHWNGFQFIESGASWVISTLFPGKYVSVAGSWLQYYSIAFSFLIFGVSTLSARLPFWLSGIGVILVLYRFRHLFPKPDLTFLIASFLLVSNVTFLIYARLAEYYMLGILLVLLSSLLFLDIIRDREGFSLKKLFALFVVNQLLVHDHIPSFLALFLIQNLSFLYILATNKKWNKIMIFVYFIVSTILSYGAYRLYQSSETGAVFTKIFWTVLTIYLNGINFYIMPAIGLVILIGFAWYYRAFIQVKKIIAFILIVTGIEIFLVTSFNYGGVAFRYISSMMGLWYLGIALIAVSFPKKWLALIVFIVMSVNIYTGPAKFFINSLVPEGVTAMVRKDMPTIPFMANFPTRCFYCELLTEIVMNPPHPLEPVIAQLRQINIKGKKLVNGACESSAVMFYTGASAINTIPPDLYQKTFGKTFQITDADVIMNTSFCPAKYDDIEIPKGAYSAFQMDLPQYPLINSEELNTRFTYSLRQVPQAVVFYR